MSFNYRSTDSVTEKLSCRLNTACCSYNEEWLGSETVFSLAWKKAPISINESLLVGGSQASSFPKIWEWLNFGQDILFPSCHYYFICVIFFNEVSVLKEYLKFLGIIFTNNDWDCFKWGVGLNFSHWIQMFLGWKLRGFCLLVCGLVTYLKYLVYFYFPLCLRWILS